MHSFGLLHFYTSINELISDLRRDIILRRGNFVTSSVQWHLQYVFKDSWKPQEWMFMLNKWLVVMMKNSRNVSSDEAEHCDRMRFHTDTIVSTWFVLMLFWAQLSLVSSHENIWRDLGSHHILLGTRLNLTACCWETETCLEKVTVREHRTEELSVFTLRKFTMVLL